MATRKTTKKTAKKPPKKAAKSAKPKNSRSGKPLKHSPRVKTQEELPGVIERIPEVEAAAESYREARDERMGWNEEEVKRKQELLAIMRRHNVMRCAVGEDHEAIREPGEEDVKVRKKKAPKSGRKTKEVE